jgi:hypothetical protein
MMRNNLCPNSANCPIFSGVLKGSGFEGTYKQLYCEGGEVKYKSCKRYMVKERTGKCPEKLLPNASQSIEEIIASMG